MLRLDEPAHSYAAVLDVCLEGITGNTLLRTKLEACRMEMLAAGDSYVVSSTTGELCNIAPTPECAENPVVIAEMTKSDLVGIYSQYFVARGKPARKIYDDLIVAARERCPFCGGIGRPRNLDHFLPKARFPQFSVFPKNLVPSCRDCNFDGKSARFATCPEEQLIQPYADNDKFFSEQWIFAEFSGSISDPQAKLEYFVSAPDDWSAVDRRRAMTHFDTFELSVRYAVKAAEQRGTVVSQIGLMQRAGLPITAIQEILLQPGIDKAPFSNHWQVGMYQAFISAMQ